MNRDGFSLPEILVAIVVLALALVPTMTVMFSASRGTVDVELQAKATGLASEMAEWLRAADYELLYEATASTTPRLKLPGDLTVDATTGSFRNVEEPVTTLRDDRDEEILYPPEYKKFRRVVEARRVDDLGGTFRGIFFVVKVDWTLDVKGKPGRDVVLEGYVPER